MKLFYKGRTLADDETMDKLKIKKGNTLSLLNSDESIEAAGGHFPEIDFVDISSGKIKRLKFSENAPIWREVKEGLNIFGICENSKCKAYKNK